MGEQTVNATLEAAAEADLYREYQCPHCSWRVFVPVGQPGGHDGGRPPVESDQYLADHIRYRHVS